MKKTTKEFNIYDHIDFTEEQLDDVELSFEAKTKEYNTFMTTITPEIAAFILAHHNKDNRKFTMAQVVSIYNSILEDGWLADGQPLTFNVEGNITEFQHRLLAIVKAGVTVVVPVTTGVELNCFTKCAPAKQRKAEDEIQRKDKTATATEATVLRQILSRRRGEKLTIKNAIDKWVLWNQYVREGVLLVDQFFNDTEEYGPWKRTVAAWASLMISIGEKETASTFISLLGEELVEPEKSYTLTKEFHEFFKENCALMSNSGRTEFLWQLLCIAADRMQKQPNGSIQLGVTIDRCTHDNLKKRGHYRKFLENPDNIQISKPPF